MTTVCYNRMCLLPRNRGLVLKLRERKTRGAVFHHSFLFLPLHSKPPLHQVMQLLFQDGEKEGREIEHRRKGMLFGQKWDFFKQSEHISVVSNLFLWLLFYSQGTSVAWQWITRHPVTKEKVNPLIRLRDAFLPARLNRAGLANNIFEMTAVPDTPLQMNM